MDKNKELKDLLPDKNSVFFRSFDNVVEDNIINKGEIIEKIKTVFDPEIPVNIYDLGLVYNIDIDSDNNIGIKMTLTTPNCPVAESLPQEVANKILSLIRMSLPIVDSWVLLPQLSRNLKCLQQMCIYILI